MVCLRQTTTGSSNPPKRLRFQSIRQYIFRTPVDGFFSSLPFTPPCYERRLGFRTFDLSPASSPQPTIFLTFLSYSVTREGSPSFGFPLPQGFVFWLAQNVDEASRNGNEPLVPREYLSCSYPPSYQALYRAPFPALPRDQSE